MIIAAVLLTVFQNFNVSKGAEEIDYSSFLELEVYDGSGYVCSAFFDESLAVSVDPSSWSTDRVSLMAKLVFMLRSASGEISTRHLPVVPCSRSPFRQ